MHVIRCRNVQDALPLGLAHLAAVGVPMPSRAGEVIAAPGPVTTVYERPNERVVFWPERDANPPFHAMEAAWMLNGRRDLAFLTQFVKRFSEYSDDGHTLAGAYGYRWKKHFHEGKSTPAGVYPVPIDQIERVIALLKAEPFSRRAVITMFDPVEDLRTDEASKDIPCNLTICLRVIYGRKDEPNQLHMTTLARSHDIIFGAYGANAVHFSVLLEYLAARLGLAVGTYTQISNNYHAYRDVYLKTARGALDPALSPPAPGENPYITGEVSPYPMVKNPDTWDRDLALFMEAPHAYGFDNPWFSAVAKPIWFCNKAVRQRKFDEALEIIEQCKATDWKKATKEWIHRKQIRTQEKLVGRPEYGAVEKEYDTRGLSK